jgi:hypothetical protein
MGEAIQAFNPEEKVQVGSTCLRLFYYQRSRAYRISRIGRITFKEEASLSISQPFNCY